MIDYSTWHSLRELDEAAGLPKGSAFRAFKRLRSDLREGEDFLVLDHQTHSALVAALHAQDRLYRSSVRPVLLAGGAAARLAERLRQRDPEP